MSASGVRLFDDDLAADVRDLFREYLKRGESGSQASRMLVDGFEDVVGTDEEGVFWLALAYVQWEHGLLQRRSLRKAMRAIDDGSDLRRWADDPELHRKRKRVLERLRLQLATPPRKPKIVRPRKRLPPKCEWGRGDIFAYKLRSGFFLLMRVIDVTDNVGADLPLCELLDWVGTAIPDAHEVEVLPIRRNKRYPSESMFYFPPLKKHLARCQTLGIQTPTVLGNDRSYVLAIDFNKLPEDLEEYFGMSIDA